MPNATANNNELHRRDLKSLPPDGFVEARRLTYGEKLQRRAMVSGLKVESKKGSKDFAGEMQLITEESTMFDFQRCIIDHNCEDADGNKINLSTKAGISSLNPRVGEEIDTFLGELNNYEEDEEN